ncbi:MAG: AAA family ATPase, partial [Bacteroides sp.]
MYAPRRMPIGTQTFEDIRKKELLYIDKTRYIASLTERFKYIFLSRPHRFGKSLFLSTLR